MLQASLRGERALLERVKRSWRAEREWTRELREQIHRLQAQAGVFGHHDVHALVLETAIELVEAEKGLLLSRRDADGDGDLDLVVAHGFAHDAEHSAVAQRFAREVLERDRILREDHPRPPARSDVTPADEEIETLVAIPLYLRDRFSGVVVCANREGGFGEVDDDVLLGLGDQAGAAMHHGHLRQELHDAHRAGVRMLVETVAARDPLAHRESAQMAVRAVTLAAELGLDERERDVLVCATLLRTVGSLALADAVLAKPGPLEPDERAAVELHPRIGFDVIGQLPALRDVAGAVLYHHERYDGSGYPAGLTGHEIPIAARAVAVLEAFAAMTHDRPHRAARSVEEACDELLRCAGTQFDPGIVASFIEEVLGAPGSPDEELADAVLESLPLDAAGTAAGVLGPLVGPGTDGLTLLGNHRALQEGMRAAARASTPDSPCALVLIQLEDLARVNAEAGPLAGDRVIQAAARSAQRAAARLGGSAYRASGRRLAVVAPVRAGSEPSAVLDDVRTELVGGPAVRTALALCDAGETGDEILARARGALEGEAA